MNKKKLVIVTLLCSIFFPPSLYAKDFSWEMFLPAITGKGAKRDVCDQVHLYLCKDELSCMNARGYWYNNTCNIIPPPYPGSLQFNMSGLVGLVKSYRGHLKSSINKMDSTPKVTNTTTPVMGIDITDNLVEITNENLPIREFIISPTGEVYIVLESLYSYIDQNGKQHQTILLKVNPNNNTYTDIDNTMSSINTSQQGFYSNKSVQFDAAGNIYYVGYSNSNNQVLRRSNGNTHTDLINDNVSIGQWLVVEDGTVFISGATTSTGTQWFRKIHPNNSIANIIGSNAAITFLNKFPDNKVYFGEWGKLFGVGKIQPTDDTLSEKCLLGGVIGGLCDTGGLLGNDYEVYPTCTTNGLGFNQCGLSGSYGTAVTDIQSTNNSVLVLTGSASKQIWSYYPTVKHINVTMAEDVRLFKTDGSSLIVHGLNSLTQNKLVKYDLISSAETDLLPSDDIEIYHINIKSDGKIWFDGLRFSNNTYVIGYVNTSNSNQVVFIQDTTVKLEDFQTF